MSTVRRLFCALLCFALLISAFVFSGSAVAPGNPYNEDLTHLYEMKYGHALDRVFVYMRRVEIKSYPFYNDPQVARIIQYDTAMIFEPDDEGTLPVHAAPGDVLYPSLVYLNTKDEDNLNAFIEKYKNAEGVALIESDGLGYIPETRFAVKVDLRLTDRETGALLPEPALTPAFFGEACVSAVYTVDVRDRLLTGNEDARFAAEMLTEKYGELLSKGRACEAILEIKDADPAAAADFTLALIDFENSPYFTRTQKELFRQYIDNVELFAYDGCSEPEPLKTLTQTHVFKVWTTRCDEENPFENISEAEAAHKAVTNGEYAKIWYVYPKDNERETLAALAEKLESVSCVLDYVCYNGVEMIGVSARDAEANYLFHGSILVPGDVTHDRKVTTADARAALRIAIGLDSTASYGEMATVAADTNGDGEVTTADARNLLRAAVGLDSAESLHFKIRTYSPLLLGPLPSYHDGGYRWNAEIIQGDEKNVSVVQREVMTAPSLPGSGPDTFYAVQAEAPGVYRLRITASRPWEDASVPPVETYEYEIIVKD